MTLEDAKVANIRNWRIAFEQSRWRFHFRPATVALGSACLILLLVYVVLARTWIRPELPWEMLANDITRFLIFGLGFACASGFLGKHQKLHTVDFLRRYEAALVRGQVDRFHLGAGRDEAALNRALWEDWKMQPMRRRLSAIPVPGTILIATFEVLSWRKEVLNRLFVFQQTEQWPNLPSGETILIWPIVVVSILHLISVMLLVAFMARAAGVQPHAAAQASPVKCRKVFHAKP